MPATTIPHGWRSIPYLFAESSAVLRNPINQWGDLIEYSCAHLPRKIRTDEIWTNDLGLVLFRTWIMEDPDSSSFTLFSHRCSVVNLIMDNFNPWLAHITQEEAWFNPNNVEVQFIEDDD